jgi:hypothetical protein
MQYYEILIFANHPFVASNNNDNTMHDMRRTCTESAHAIARLLLLYERQWTLRRIHIQAIHIGFSASLVHLHSAYAPGTARHVKLRSLADLKIRCQALREFSTGFNSGTYASSECVVMSHVKWILAHAP